MSCFNESRLNKKIVMVLKNENKKRHGHLGGSDADAHAG